MYRRKKRIGTRSLRILGAWLVFGAHLYGFGDGRLDRFEGSFEGHGSKKSFRSASSSDKNDDPWIGFLGKMIGIGLLAGGAHADAVAEEREPGEPLVPVVNMQTGVQWVDEDVTAYDVGVEVGHGLAAGSVRATRFVEESEDDTLSLIQAHLLYRMAVTRRLEWDLGLGGAWLRGGESESGFSFASPVRWWPLEWAGVEVRPVWSWFDGVELRDVDAGMVFRYEQLTVRLGYRWLDPEGAEVDLNGLRAAVGWRF